MHRKKSTKYPVQAGSNVKFKKCAVNITPGSSPLTDFEDWQAQMLLLIVVTTREKVRIL